MPSEIEAGDIVWLDSPELLKIHGKRPLLVQRVAGNIVVLLELDGSKPLTACETNDALYLFDHVVRKDEFLSALEQAKKAYAKV